ncbi:hypothetical protein Barb6_01717 [Bacteroidales bacterium Barb6]|nr:hypothetical protein Barb6_01937 [Bacteroidales bacterium Barb6]OAV70509.1 hypothetical protein Barb6_01717 [Bacteroidales bacterium Barb6]
MAHIIEKDQSGKARYAHIDTEILPYNKEYVEMINQAEKDIEAGKGKKIAIDDLWK